jgi:outer membrane lipoprotein SlyB
MKFSFKKRLMISAALATLMVSGCSSTPRVPKMYVDASINSIDRAPKICTTDNNGRGNPIAGAAVGGLLGNQFGKGKGRVAMTLLGAVVGVSVTKGDKRSGSKLECKSNGYIASVSFIDPQSGRVATDFVRLAKYTRQKALNIPVCLYTQGTRACV